MKEINFIRILMAFAVVCISQSCQKDDGGPVISENEEFSAGENFTTFDFSENAFGVQARGLSHDESNLFVSGNSLFRNNWVQAPASVESLDGLGPVYNAISCGSCHFKDGRAAPPEEFSVQRSGLLFRLSIDGVDRHGGPVPHPVYGGQFQDRSLPGVRPEVNIEIKHQIIEGSYPDGIGYQLQKPEYIVKEQFYNQIIEPYYISPRIAPQLAGMGLLESIPREDILELADPEDMNSDGISGKPNMVYDVVENNLVLGRFGWKANQPGIRQQNAGAFNGDLGLTSNLFPDDDFTDSQAAEYEPIINGGQPEISDMQLDRITLYIQALSVPARRNTDTKNYANGKVLFERINCSACHHNRFVTCTGNTLKVLDGQEIFPYTDLLLHNMGPDLADHRSDYQANGLEWKTPPLWGIGLIPTVNGHTRLLHDGRARNIEEAILWHDGEAEESKLQFMQLSKEERDDLIFFVNSL